MNPPVELWAAAFVVTLVLEVPVVTWMTRLILGTPGALVLAVGLQLLTHPALWYLVPRFEPYWAWVVLAEIGVLMVESGVLWAVLRAAGDPHPKSRALVACTLANLLSMAAALLFY